MTIFPYASEPEKNEQSLCKDALWPNEIFSSAQQKGDTFPFFWFRTKKLYEAMLLKLMLFSKESSSCQIEFSVNDSLSRRGKLDFGLQPLCFIRLVLTAHAFVRSEVQSDIKGQDFMSLLPKGQVETWRFLHCHALIE